MTMTESENSISDQVRHPSSYLVTHPTEFLQDLFFRACECVGIIEADVHTLPYLSNECRATLLGSTAYSDDIIPALIQILRHVLGEMGTDIDAYLSHHLYCKWMDLRGWSYSCRAYFCIGMKVLKDAVGHLTAAPVACTKDKISHRLQI